MYKIMRYLPDEHATQQWRRFAQVMPSVPGPGRHAIPARHRCGCSGLLSAGGAGRRRARASMRGSRHEILPISPLMLVQIGNKRTMRRGPASPGRSTTSTWPLDRWAEVFAIPAAEIIPRPTPSCCPRHGPPNTQAQPRACMAVPISAQAFHKRGRRSARIPRPAGTARARADGLLKPFRFRVPRTPPPASACPQVVAVRQGIAFAVSALGAWRGADVRLLPR